MKFTQFPESPMSFYPRIYFRAEHQAPGAKHGTVRCRGWSDHTEEHFSPCSMSTLRRGNSVYSTDKICQTGARSLGVQPAQTAMYGPASFGPSAATS